MSSIARSCRARWLRMRPCRLMDVMDVTGGSCSRWGRRLRACCLVNRSMRSPRCSSLHPQTKLVLVVPAGSDIKTRHGIDVIEDVKGLLAERFDARSGTFYLLVPIQSRRDACPLPSIHTTVREALAPPTTCTLNETQSA